MEDPPAPAEGLADHDPDHMPDGSAVPPGFQWDGFRLVRARKSSRPPGIPSDMWKLASPKERARVAEEYRKELAMKKEAKPAAADVAATAVCVQPNHAVHGQGGTVTKLPSPAAVASAIPEMLAPAMPVTVNEKGKTVHEHRACVTAVIEEHIKDNREDLVNALLMTAAVARLIPRSEVANTPEAKKALDVEWEKLRSKGTWDESRVKECKTVIAEAKAKGEKAHIARIFEACYLKGSELAVGDPSRKYKGRTVFRRKPCC